MWYTLPPGKNNKRSSAQAEFLAKHYITTGYIKAWESQLETREPGIVLKLMPAEMFLTEAEPCILPPPAPKKTEYHILIELKLNNAEYIIKQHRDQKIEAREALKMLREIIGATDYRLQPIYSVQPEDKERIYIARHGSYLKVHTPWDGVATQHYSNQAKKIKGKSFNGGVYMFPESEWDQVLVLLKKYFSGYFLAGEMGNLEL